MINKKIQLVLLILIPLCFSTDLEGKTIDLTREKLFLREGFEKTWTNELPTGKRWKEVPASTTGKRPVRIVDQGLPGLPVRTFFSPFGTDPREFTFVTSFKIEKGDAQKARVPGLYIKRIAFNWEIYINGRLIKSEMHRDKDGSLNRLCSYRNVLIDINPRYLNTGRNILAFRIVGDPTHVNTGLLSGGPHLIGDYVELESFRSETVILILVFIYIFVGLYHLLLFYNRRSEQYNLFFGLLTIDISFYFFSRTHAIFSIIPDTAIVVRIEFISLFLLLPVGLFFFDYLLNSTVSLFSKIVLGGYTLLALAILPTSITFSEDILLVWQVTAVFPLGYILWITSYKFYEAIRDHITRQNFQGNRLLLALRMMGSEVSGNLLIGVILLFFTSIFDIVDARFFHFDILLSRYFFFIMIIGMTVLLANRFIYIHNKIEILNRNLEEKVEDLNQANIHISHSEEKYRLLVEGSNDIIFSLDEDLRFITANKALKEQLKMDNEKIEGLEFYEIISDEINQMEINSDFVRKKVQELQTKRKAVKFKTELISRHLKEPVVMQIKLQYVNIEGKDEILGRASRESEDSLLKYFVAEKQKLRIENFLITADEVSRRMTRNLPKYCGESDADLVRLALREIIVNSIEHGNLEITFEEKTESMMEGNYLELIENRQREALYRDRKITVEYMINSKNVIFTIVDEGTGFDFTEMIDEKNDRANEEMLAHGRGIKMAQNIFDSVEFFGKGNQVKLVKNFK